MRFASDFKELESLFGRKRLFFGEEWKFEGGEFFDPCGIFSVRKGAEGIKDRLPKRTKIAGARFGCFGHAPKERLFEFGESFKKSIALA